MQELRLFFGSAESASWFRRTLSTASVNVVLTAINPQRLRKKGYAVSKAGVGGCVCAVNTHPMISADDNTAAGSGNCTGGPLCPLNHARVGTCVRIRQLPESAELTTRLREIGLGEDQTVRLVSTRNNVICQVCNSRLAISVELAQSILVEPVGFARAA